MHKSSQLEAAHGLQTPFLVRQNRRELAHPADPARAPAETSDPAPVLPAGQLASEDISARLPRPILWLAFAGWVVCCGMLFITLVQREPPESPGRAWTADVLLPSGMVRRRRLGRALRSTRPGRTAIGRTALSSTFLKPVRAP
jgi:hypothetical protein